MELPARSRTQSLALEELKVDGEKPSIRVVTAEARHRSLDGDPVSFSSGGKSLGLPYRRKNKRKRSRKMAKDKKLVKEITSMEEEFLPSGIQM